MLRSQISYYIFWEPLSHQSDHPIFYFPKQWMAKGKGNSWGYIATGCLVSLMFWRLVRQPDCIPQVGGQLDNLSVMYNQAWWKWYMHIHTYTQQIYIYIYIYIKKERKRKREREREIHPHTHTHTHIHKSKMPSANMTSQVYSSEYTSAP